MNHLLTWSIYYFPWRCWLFNISHLPNRIVQKFYFDVIVRPRIFVFFIQINFADFSNIVVTRTLVRSDSRTWNPCIFHFISSNFYGVSSFRIPFRFHKLWKHLLHFLIFLFSFFFAPQYSIDPQGFFDLKDLVSSTL